MHRGRPGLVRVAACLLVLIAGSAVAQITPAEPGIEPVRTARAVSVERPPKMDGTLDDPIWQLAKPITDFRQREPFEGQRATEATAVRSLYPHKDVYFGIACHDSTPHGVIASQLRRDVDQEFDDHFEISIDSRRDRRLPERWGDLP